MTSMLQYITWYDETILRRQSSSRSSGGNGIRNRTPTSVLQQKHSHSLAVDERRRTWLPPAVWQELGMQLLLLLLD